MTLLRLIWEFFLTGMFAIGGGLTTFPFLMNMSLKYGWFSPEELIDMIAVSESTPGAIGINMATYAGLKVSGPAGGILATIFLVIPSVVIIWTMLPFLDKYRESRLVEGIFYALRPISAGLIAAALARIMEISFFFVSESFLGPINWLAGLIFGLFFGLIQLKPRIHPILVILAGALIGVLLKL